MKTQLYLFCLATLAASCGETKQSQGYSIEGNIKGVDTGLVKLTSYDDETRTSKVLDSVPLTNGVFHIKGTIPGPEMASITIGEGNWGLSFFLENSNITIKADTTGAEHYDYVAYGGAKGAVLKDFTITGSANQDQLMAFQNNPGLKQYETIQAELGKAYQNAPNKEEGYKIKEQLDSIGDLSMAARKRIIDSFAVASPATAASVYLLYDYYRFNEAMTAADLESAISKYSGPAQSTVYFKSLLKNLEKKKGLLPGKPAPDFTLLKRDSSQFTLSSLRGKYVMLDFWASWCVPCRKAIPHWKEAYAKYQPKGFEIVGITNDSRWSDWFKALDEEKMPWLQVADEFPEKFMPSRVGTMYMTPYLPCYILLDKEGKIILHNPSKEELDAKLKELMGA
ncbi:TlpA disulfide reductase family protein [Pseudobacter ginsenosidimutans]|uniref:Peroxiredoxin n=1 Tax=Pseudobacter ginsenosidimutans TaxID=661488 RepID=A0A4Q7N5G7_9BACT|nr:TlpA disulfide reductase family protein [Pseudobacter ginsenosidimutans]QEC44791.1 AhpC/TSA family protein [Pseudobacter ginsenosidimutans]RZS76278.1 peroxiredoxin [Pseudobacter ginsenosidimutans]